MESNYIHDVEAEKIVLGTLLTERNALSQVREILSPKCFYNKFHEEVYCAICAVAERGDRPDIISVQAELKKMGVTFQPFELVSIAANGTFDLYQHACRINELEKRRRFVEIGQKLISQGSTEVEDIEDILSSTTDSLSGVLGDISTHVKTANDYLSDVYQQVNANLNGTNIPGTPTGFSVIDDKGGFQPTNLIICAAESSQGKTSFANAITLAAAKAGASIAFYSMEMTGKQLMTRFAAMESNIPAGRLFNEQLTTEELHSFDIAVGALSGLGIYFDDRSTSNIDSIIASIRSLKIKHNIQGAIIDYLQILTVNKKAESVEESLAEATRRLKNLAKELDIWILALSQLSRDAQNPVPTVNRLRGSGQMNEAADLTLLLYRPEVYGKRYPTPFENTDPQGTALIDVAKGRNTGPYKFIAGFNASTTKFFELNERPILPFTPKNEEPF
ncbi:MAG: replicative DNA helicase [Bacteroides sp.]|jgi:replicative DNA helicase|nr:replicative DNA helicase [Bacteroides sp.]MCI1681123.1 replicative DNA helicase [Bacteroides sp.]